MRLTPLGSDETKPIPAWLWLQRQVGHLFDVVTDRLYGSLSRPEIQKFLTRNIFTRSFARRDAAALYDICVGFTYSQTLTACIELNLFVILSREPRSAAILSQELDIPCDSLETLLTGAVSLKLLVLRRDGRYTVGRLGTAVLADPGIATIVRHHALLYRDLSEPVDLLRAPLDSEMADFWAYTQDDAVGTIDKTKAERYSTVMATTQAMVRDQILAAYDFSSAQRILDIGSGTGTFASALLNKYDHVNVTLFDLPAVIELAKQRVADTSPHQARAIFCPGDFAAASLPKAQDLVTMVRVLHDQDQHRALALLAKARSALKPGGTLLIAETLIESERHAPIGAAYFGWFLLAMGRGKARTKGEVKDLLRQSGFQRIREHKTTLPMVVRVITATH